MKKFYAVLIVFAALFLSFDISFAREEIYPGPPLIITSGTYSGADDEYVNGGIFYNAGELIINNLTGNIKFINNESMRGAAIFAASGSTTTIGGSVEFSYNTASDPGGAICNEGLLTIGSDSKFSFNESYWSGGAIITNELSTTTIDNGVLFLSNTAIGWGGAIANGGLLTIGDNVMFAYNTVKDNSGKAYGGAIYNNYEAGTINIGTGAVFSFNTSEICGGAIYNEGVMTIGEKANFSSNSASHNMNDTYGGAICNIGNLTISTGAQFNENYADSGGAIYNAEELTIEDGALFFNNMSGSGSGGAINTDFGSITTIGSNAYFDSNNTFNSGGAIYNAGVMTIGEKANFFNNSAYLNMGGAIYNIGNLTISTGAKFISNSAISGGAIYNAGSLTIEDGALFFNNGGAIYNDGGTLNLTAETQKIEFAYNGTDIYDNNGTINLYTKGADIIFNDDIWSFNQNSTLNINDTTDPVKGKVILNANMENYDGQINLYSGTVELGEYGTWFSGNTYIDNAEINLINGRPDNGIDFWDFNLDTELRLSVEADLETEEMDRIYADSFLGAGKIKVNAVKVLKDGNKKVTDLYFAGGALIEQVESVNVGYSPVYKYNVKYFTDYYTYGPNGIMRFERSGANPLAQAASISNFGIYTAQSEIVKQVFSNAAGGRLEKRASLKDNLYVSADSNRVFSGSSLKRGVWVSPYIVKDTIEFGKYVKDVENSVNGILAGVDLVVDKDNGISLYCGYNGGSQKYDNVEMSQSGYILGASGIILKGKFYFGAAANVIINNNEAKSSLGTSEMENLGYTAGFKGGYDITAGNNWTIEPNMIVMYSELTASEYINAEGHKIKDEGIKGLLVKPGVKAKVDLKDGWQPYGLMDITINTGESATKVSGIDTESLKLAPYYEFGLGVNKDFANTPWSAYAQLTGKSGSRAGAGINLGVKYAF